jgi:4-hydroxy-2-oxoheptanedioate aldolase
MEHEGFDFPNLRLSLQFLLNRQRIAKKGGVQPDTVPFVRVPPNAREMNQWVIKQSLDTGVYGLIIPHLDTVEQAQAAVVACRYPQASGVPDFEPAGQRGWAPLGAPRYWGLTARDYTAGADLWPLDPQGELFFMPLVEGVEGVRNLPQILKEVKGIGAIWAGSGDLAMELGVPGNMADPQGRGVLSADSESLQRGQRAVRLHRIPPRRRREKNRTGLRHHHHDTNAGG